jgi:hypothetical protein
MSVPPINISNTLNHCTFIGFTCEIYDPTRSTPGGGGGYDEKKEKKGRNTMIKRKDGRIMESTRVK